MRNDAMSTVPKRSTRRVKAGGGGAMRRKHDTHLKPAVCDEFNEPASLRDHSKPHGVSMARGRSVCPYACVRLSIHPSVHQSATVHTKGVLQPHGVVLSDYCSF